MPRSSSILVLFFSCGPFAIAGFIVSVVVDAFNGQSGRLFAHVREKIQKRVSPSFADANPSSAVVFIAAKCFGRATTKHVSPTVMGRRIGVSMNYADFPATATFGIARPQVAAKYNCFNAALARTSPPRLASCAMRKRDNLQFAEPSAGNIFDAAVLRRVRGVAAGARGCG